MIEFSLNGKPARYDGEASRSLLSFLREDARILSPKDGCSGQGACGACLVEINGKAALSCRMEMSRMSGADVVTIEGFPEKLRKTLGKAFAAKGAVQCGYCTPGFLTRAKILLQKTQNPTRDEIRSALRFQLCRCTGYVKIVDAVLEAARSLRTGTPVVSETRPSIGSRLPKPDAFARAIGAAAFVRDLQIPGLLHGALKFSDHPRARIVSIDTGAAAGAPGVIAVFTASDVPGERFTGVIRQDWPLMVAPGEETRYIGDVLAAVVATTETAARAAAAHISVEYEVLEPLTEMRSAEDSPILLHPDGNVLEAVNLSQGGEVGQALSASAYVAKSTYSTQRVEHAFLETEGAIAVPADDGGVELYVQSQGIYDDRRSVARILGIAEELVKTRLVPTGGAFGGKEDLTVQGHAALCAYLAKRPVRFCLSRPESIRMHPKRHPFVMEYELGCDAGGKLTGLRANILSDAGAYASVSSEVITRAACHATGAYFVPNVEIDAKTVFTNNIPGGAMRGFGVNQVTFAMESAVEELCILGNFDRWQFRYDNALESGLSIPSGQILGEGVGLKQTLLAVKEEFGAARYAGIGCGIKSCGIGNGVIDECEVRIDVLPEGRLVLHHGWTEMGQGVDTVARQVLSEELGLQSADLIDIVVSTESRAAAGMTTGSRATTLLGNAIVDAARKLRVDLDGEPHEALAGRTYTGRWACDWTTSYDAKGEVISHYAYGYATHVVILDDDGSITKVIAAHDGGRIINTMAFEGQIEGSVVMGLGYALSEELPSENGQLPTDRLSQLGLLKIQRVPEIVVKNVEVPDPVGPYGAKGVGEIGLIPTPGAVAGALRSFDGKRRNSLPISFRER